MAIWADRVTVKKAIGVAPFDLVYGIQAKMPQNNLMGLYNYIQLYDEDTTDEMQERMDELVGLTETRREASLKNQKLQLQVKTLYDKRTVSRKFEDGDLVLIWTARIEDKGKHSKFDPIWLGPYLIENTWGEDS